MTSYNTDIIHDVTSFIRSTAKTCSFNARHFHHIMYHARAHYVTTTGTCWRTRSTATVTWAGSARGSAASTWSRASHAAISRKSSRTLQSRTSRQATSRVRVRTSYSYWLVSLCVSGYVPLAGVVWRNVCLNVRHFVSSEPADVNHVGCHSGRVPCCTYGGPGKSLLHTTD